jgi:glycosyltransferase involved in cell wall biosynthesis
LINTSWREGLPISYVEASAHQCAILSSLNPDDFTRQFGFWAEKGDLDDYEHGLRCLLEEDRWKERGMRGQEYVKKTFESDRAIERHIAVYESLLGK